MKTKFYFLVGLMTVLLLITGCKSSKVDDSAPDTNEDDTVTEEDVEVKDRAYYDELFKETDELAMQTFEAFVEFNFPFFVEVLSPKGYEELEAFIEENSFDSLDEHVDVGLFEEYGVNYEMKRYDEYFNKDEGVIHYRVVAAHPRTIREKIRVDELRKEDFTEYADTINYWMTFKQNEEGEWKLKEPFNRDQPSEIIEESSSEIRPNVGTILHKAPFIDYKDDEEDDGDEWGFED